MTTDEENIENKSIPTTFVVPPMAGTRIPSVQDKVYTSRQSHLFVPKSDKPIYLYVQCLSFVIILFIRILHVVGEDDDLVGMPKFMDDLLI